MKNLWIKLFGNETSWGIIPGFFHSLKRKWFPYMRDGKELQYIIKKLKKQI